MVKDEHFCLWKDHYFEAQQKTLTRSLTEIRSQLYSRVYPPIAGKDRSLSTLKIRYVQAVFYENKISFAGVIFDHVRG